MMKSEEQAIFVFVDEVLPPTAALMSSIYEEHKDDDGCARFGAPSPSNLHAALSGVTRTASST